MPQQLMVKRTPKKTRQAAVDLFYAVEDATEEYVSLFVKLKLHTTILCVLCSTC